MQNSHKTLWALLDEARWQDNQTIVNLLLEIGTHKLASPPAHTSLADDWLGLSNLFIKYHQKETEKTINTEDEEPLQCQICWENYNWGNRRAFVFQCGHSCCSTCLDKENKMNRIHKCHLCRKVVVDKQRMN
jgi:hypothetical protein